MLPQTTADNYHGWPAPTGLGRQCHDARPDRSARRVRTRFHTVRNYSTLADRVTTRDMITMGSTCLPCCLNPPDVAPLGSPPHTIYFERRGLKRKLRDPVQRPELMLRWFHA